MWLNFLVRVFVCVFFMWISLINIHVYIFWFSFILIPSICNLWYVCCFVVWFASFYVHFCIYFFLFLILIYMLELSFSKTMFDNSTPNVALNRNKKCDESINKSSDKSVLILKRLCAELCVRSMGHW